MAKSFVFDGCAICTATRTAEAEGRSLSEAELIAAFKEQNDRQAGQARKKPGDRQSEQGVPFNGDAERNGAEKVGDPTA